MKLLRLSAIAATALVVVACGGSDAPWVPKGGELLSAPQWIGTLTAAQIDAATTANGLIALTGPAKCAVRMLAINYATTGVGGETDRTNSSGVMLVPEGPAGTSCTAPASLLAYARGTELVKPRTLANPQDPETLMLTAFYAAQGYAVVATDYLGYAHSAYPFHPYLHAHSEATTVLDSVRAARNVADETGVRLTDRVMFSGYSQGGHASMAAHRMAERFYDKEFNVVGGAHLAGPYNLAGAMKVTQAIAGYQFFVPFIITAWQKTYGDIYKSPAEAFKAPYVTTIEDLLPNATLNAAGLVAAGRLPGGTPDQARDALMQPAFLTAMYTDDKVPINAAARDNTLVGLGWKPNAPITLCGGAGDPTVVPAVHQVPMMASFGAAGATNVKSVDVDPLIQATYGPGGKAPTNPASAEYAAYYGSYHGIYEPPFCMAAARGLFDLVR